jgi:predicted RNase H-like nuclease
VASDSPPFSTAHKQRVRRTGSSPYACFYQLKGGKPPANKQKAEGRHQRVELLGTHLDLPAGVKAWAHDGLDAAVAALLAYQRRAGAIQVQHECANSDGSELWVPV